VYRNKVFFYNSHSFNNIYTKKLCYLKLSIHHQYPQQCHVIVTDILSALQILHICTYTHLTIQLLPKSWTGFPRRGKLVVCCWVPALGLPDNKPTSAVVNDAAVHGELSSDKALGGDVDAHLHEILLSAW